MSNAPQPAEKKPKYSFEDRLSIYFFRACARMNKNNLDLGDEDVIKVTSETHHTLEEYKRGKELTIEYLMNHPKYFNQGLSLVSDDDSQSLKWIRLIMRYFKISCRPSREHVERFIAEVIHDECGDLHRVLKQGYEIVQPLMLKQNIDVEEALTFSLCE